VRPRPWLQLLGPHLRLILHHPATWAGVLGWSLRRGAPGLRGRLWQVFYFGEAVVLAGECRRQGVRHLHAHHANVAADLAWIAAELGGRLDGPGSWAWTLTFHGSSELAEVRRIRLPEKLASAAKVLCVAEHTRAQLLPWVDDADWDKLVVVHTGADLQRYRPAEIADRSAGRPAEILCVGRIDPVKGYPLLIDAVARLREEDVDCRLTIVGGGQGADRLERRVRDRRLEGRVRLLGAVGQDELPALYREADVFCLPSFTESLPVVLMEAMASGLPVVATRVAAIPELVRDGESGLLVAPGRTDLLAGALRRLIAEPAVRAAMGCAGRAAVEAGFDADACGRRAAAELAEVARRLRPVARSE
ncbi:MAG TPA: glycosyltransferase family 4 protein, partial [Acidimicrobiales bacterium]|nr:glycosyltransferase family 4 protein [Acidimicrobiales bacterium]